MTPDLQYQAAIDLVMGYRDENGNWKPGAKEFVKKDKSKLFTSMFIPFQLLYVEMAKRGEITTLKDLGKDKLMLYWTMACAGLPDAPKWKKICITQAIYMHDLIQNSNP